MRGARQALSILSLWLPALAILLTGLAWRDRLPEMVPTHWGAAGPADAAGATSVVFYWTIGVAGVAALLGLILLLAPLNGPWVKRTAAAITGAIAIEALAIWLVSAAPSLGVADPYSVELGPWVMVLVLAPAYAAVPLFLYPPDLTGSDRRVPTSPNPQAITIRSGSWTQIETSKLFVAITLILLLVGVLILGALLFKGLTLLGGWEVLLYAATLTVVAVFWSFKITVNEDGLRITSRLFGVRIKHIAPGEIAEVTVMHIDPMKWGGWGYRLSPGRSALVLKEGPGLVVTTRDGKQFAVTVDDPEVPAGILLGLVSSGAPGSAR